MAVWASRTLEQFLLHVHWLHACKQTGRDTSFIEATTALESATINIELTKGSTCNNHVTLIKNKGKGTKGGESDGTPSVVAMETAN